MYTLEKTLVQSLMKEWFDAVKYIDVIEKEYPYLIASFEIKYTKVFQILKYSLFSLSEDEFNAILHQRYKKIKNNYSIIITECAINHMDLYILIKQLHQIINNYSLMLVQVTALYNLLTISPNSEKWYNEIKNSEIDRETLLNLLNKKTKNVDNLLLSIEVMNNLIHTYHQLIIADMVQIQTQNIDEDAKG